MPKSSPSAFQPQVCAIVLTLNEAKHIGACVDSLAWADARIVFDSFSTDTTCTIAREHGARVIQNKFENYAQQRNAALAAAQAQWVFFLDADERCTPDLAQEIRSTLRAPQSTVYSVPRHNYLFGKLTLGAGWYPDFQARLFEVGKAGFDPTRFVHETAVFTGSMGYLKSVLIHYNYENVPQFHAKQRKYAEYDARILFDQGIRPKPRNFVLQPLREFLRRFITWRGFKDGVHGLHLSVLMAYYNFDMYRRLAGMWRSSKP